MQDYHDLKVWEKSHKFTLAIYAATKEFPKEEIYGLTSQLRRATASIPTNLAEGTGPRTSKELAQFSQIAAGSASEVDYQLLLYRELDYLSEDDYNILIKQLLEIRKMLTSLIKKLRSAS